MWCSNSLRYIVFVHFEHLIVRRRVEPADFESWVKRLHILSGLRCDFGRAAEEENTETACRGEFDQKGNQVRAGHALWQWLTQVTRSPDQRLAIAKDEIGFDEDTVEFDIGACLDEKIDVRSHDVVRAPRMDHLFDALNGLFESNR